MNWLNKCCRYLLSRYENNYLSKYYLSIRELPLINWFLLMEDDNLIHLSKTGKVCKRVNKVYDMIQSQLIDEFGISENFIEIIKKKVRIELYYGEQIQTGDRSNQIFINILERELELLDGENVKQDLFQSVISIEKVLGFKINSKELSVYEYYKYCKFVENSLKSTHGRIG